MCRHHCHIADHGREAGPSGALRFDHRKRNALLAEQGLFDMIFADTICVRSGVEVEDLGLKPRVNRYVAARPDARLASD